MSCTLCTIQKLAIRRKKKHNKRRREERDVSTNVPRDRNVDKRGTKKISEITKPRFVKARVAERRTLIDE